MKRIAIRIVLFLLVLSCVLLLVFQATGDILVNKDNNRYYMLEHELEQKDERYEVQVYGSCHAYTSFDSTFLTEKYKISCYNMSNPGEIIPTTYLRMLDIPLCPSFSGWQFPPVPDNERLPYCRLQFHIRKYKPSSVHQFPVL